MLTYSLDKTYMRKYNIIKCQYILSEMVTEILRIKFSWEIHK